MGRGPTPQELSAGKRRVVKQFVKSVVAACQPAIPAVITGNIVQLGARFAQIGYHVAQASNGECCVWATASVYERKPHGDEQVAVFTQPSWLAYGCSVEAVVAALKDEVV